ncbi:hypothetical protein A0H81_08554 [Grifola frondosa]|uniref:Uncharacterized protein n=1 Tax=Grifola frondosa TaxID=5627 RepID=A0A1C7M3W8_GRIFR|nr:hypothetical protein A0H81_08554 [Grifola frondosa]
MLSTLNHDTMRITFDYMHVGDLLAFKGTSRDADCIVAEYLSGKLRSLLACYLAKPVHFRNLMRITNSIISGSAALEYILPRYNTWHADDLDIYVPHNMFNRVVSYLVLFAHYKPVFPQDMQTHYNGGIMQVVRLKNGNLQIDVIQSASMSALHPTTLFWNTALTNGISADGVYCAYPQLMLNMCGLISPCNLIGHHVPDECTVDLIVKYTMRGFDIRVREPLWSHKSVNTLLPLGAPGPACAYTVRIFGDHMGIYTSLYPYSTHTIDIIARQSIIVMWRRGGSHCAHGCNTPPREDDTFAEVIAV